MHTKNGNGQDSATNSSERPANVSTAIWGEMASLGLSLNGRLLYLFLLTGPHNTRLPGLFVLNPIDVTTTLGWPSDDVAQALEELARAGFVKIDSVVRLHWLPRVFEHRSPSDWAVLPHWREYVKALPDCELRSEAEAALQAQIEAVARDRAN